MVQSIFHIKFDWLTLMLCNCLRFSEFVDHTLHQRMAQRCNTCWTPPLNLLNPISHNNTEERNDILRRLPFEDFIHVFLCNTLTLILGLNVKILFYLEALFIIDFHLSQASMSVANFEHTGVLCWTWLNGKYKKKWPISQFNKFQ